jgi:drug/metabolite transporter (DMT)-like permease
MSDAQAPTPSTDRSVKIASYLGLVAAGSFWGLGFVFGKYALIAMPVAAMITFRFAIASVVLVPLLFFRRVRIAPRDLPAFALAALLFVPVQFIIQFEGLARTSVTHASLMVALMPVFIALASTMTRGARAARPKWVAIAASALGAVLVVFGPGGGYSVVGDALVILSLLAGVGWIVITDERLKAYDPIGASAVVVLLGTAMLVAFEAFAHPHELLASYPAGAWLATAACGIVSTAIATVCWNIGLRGVPASDAGVFINLEPLVGSLCGVLLFGDHAGWPLVVGATLIIAAAMAVTRASAQASALAVRTQSRAAAHAA